MDGILTERLVFQTKTGGCSVPWFQPGDATDWLNRCIWHLEVANVSLLRVKAAVGDLQLYRV
jgi:hypothetical protein